MTMLYSYPYYNEVCYKGAALFINCRFSPEEKAKRDPFVFMPFGHGPRNCIGMRLALLEAKMGIIHALKKVTFVKSTETEVGVIYEPMQEISAWVKVFRINPEFLVLRLTFHRKSASKC